MNNSKEINKLKYVKSPNKKDKNFSKEELDFLINSSVPRKNNRNSERGMLDEYFNNNTKFKYKKINTFNSPQKPVNFTEYDYMNENKHKIPNNPNMVFKGSF